MNQLCFLLTGHRPRPVPPSQSERGACGSPGPPAASGTSGCCCSYWGNRERRCGPRWCSSSILRRRLTGGTSGTTVRNSPLHDGFFYFYCYVYIVWILYYVLNVCICEYRGWPLLYVYVILCAMCIWYRDGRWKLAGSFIVERVTLRLSVHNSKHFVVICCLSDLSKLKIRYKVLCVKYFYVTK